MIRTDSAFRARRYLFVAALIGIGACARDESTGPSSGSQRPGGVAAAVAPSPLVAITLPQDPGDPNVFLLSAACDVLFGRPAALATTDFGTFQTLIAPLPAGAIVRLQDDPSGDGTPGVYECDARDPTDPTLFPVDPLTLHPAKGNGPGLHYDNMTLDLNGHKIVAAIVSPDPLLAPIGLFITASNVNVINSSPAVAGLTGFGHDVDAGGTNITIEGTWTDVNSDGKADPGDGFGLEFSGVRSQGAGAVTWRGIKSINLDPILGQGAMARKCTGQVATLFEHNYLVGGAEGVFIRQCAGVIVRNNFIGSPNGFGVNTRDAFGTAGFPNQILNNTIQNASAVNALAGISLVLGPRNFVISGNVVSGFPCGVQVATPGVNGVPTAAQLIANNDLSLTNPQICDANFVPAGNQPPVAAFLVSCVLLDCTFTDASTDVDGTIASWSWDFGDGGTSTLQNPIHTFATGGLKTVTLTVLDNAGGAGSISRQIAPSDPASNITLDVIGRLIRRTNLGRADLTWSGATSAQVDVRRDGTLLITTVNDGAHRDRNVPLGTHSYQICNQGTAQCSPLRSVSF